MRFKIIEHTADVGIEAFGKDLNELFANAACGMFSIITDLKKIEEKEQANIQTSQSSLEDLLHSWLNELLFKESTQDILFKKFDVRIDEKKLRLSGRVYGEKFDTNKHHLKTEIKAVTYHQLKIEKIKAKGAIYRTRVIFDV